MLLQTLAQISAVLLEALTPLIVGVIAALIYRWTGVQVEQKHMLALQSALQNGARLMLTGKTIDDAIDYVERSVPDALNSLGAKGRSRIEELLTPHIAVLPTGAAAAGRKKIVNDVRNRVLGVTDEAGE